MARCLGVVKWFNKKQGFGFINVLNGEQTGKDIFVHFSSIRCRDTQYKVLYEGEYVEFLIEKALKDNHEFQAIDITGVLEGRLMCETRQLRAPPLGHSLETAEGGAETEGGFKVVRHGRPRKAEKAD